MRLVWYELLKRAIRVPVNLVVQYRMTLTKGSTHGIFTSKANRVALHGQGGQRQCFRRRPVQRVATLGHFATTFYRATKLSMQMEFCRSTRQRDEQLAEQSLFYTRIRLIVGGFRTSKKIGPDPRLRVAVPHAANADGRDQTLY